MTAEPPTAVQTCIDEALAGLGREPDALLPLLHALQDRFGHVPARALAPLARALNLSRAEVHGVLSYYPHFRSEPAGIHLVQVCRAEACQACGADDLFEQAERELGCARGRTRADGAVTLEAVYCLGLCASSPALAIDHKLHGRVTPPRLAELVRALELAR
ncbi:MAG: formate dehydrogenase subunit gamma [Burkholderiales bacterium]|nr:formate dehydrogenase subunit gamma [Burkholderiales bacterium]